MKKKILLLCFTLIVAVAAMIALVVTTSATIYSGECGTNVTWTFNTSTSNLVISGTGNMENWSVTSHAPWKDYRSSIEKIIIRDGVTSIGEWAFHDCSNLKTITIPGSVETIGSAAFWDCSSLISVAIPDGVTSIESSTFYCCYSLTSVKMPDSVTSIGNGAFEFCYDLEDIVISNRVTCISSDAFYHCESLTKITIPQSVKNIYRYAFFYCTNLQTVEFLSEDVSFDYYVFSQCPKLKTIYLYRNSTADSYFDDDYTKIYLDDITYTIQYDANGGEGAPTSQTKGHGKTLTLSSTIPTKPNHTFKGWSTSPDGGVMYYAGGSYTANDDAILYAVWAINTYTVSYDANGGENAPNSQTKTHGVPLTLSTSEPTRTNYTFMGWSTSADGSVEYAPGAVYESDEALKLYAVWQLNEIIEGKCGSKLTWTLNTKTGEMKIEGTGSMYSWSSYNSPVPWNSFISYIKSVSIGDGATNIGSIAFSKCTNLESVTIGNSVTSIDTWAFQYCDALKSITIPDSVTIIDVRAFYNCTSLESVTIGNGVTYVGNSAFQNCTSIKNVYYTGDLAGWCNIGFNYSSGVCYSNPLYYGADFYIKNVLLENADIPGTVTAIKDYTFYGCESLKTVTIPDSVTSIGECAFYNCANIDNVYYTGDLAGWCNIGFSSVSSNPLCCGANLYINNILLENAEIPDTVTAIKKYTFYGCESIQTVTIPDSVTSIGSDAFYRCTSLKSITIPDSVTSISGRAFYNCTSIEAIYLYEGSYADSYCLANETLAPKIVYLQSPGDTNGDDIINATDAVLLAQVLAGWSVDVDLDACDCNGDGSVNAADAVLLAQYLAGWDVTLG